VTKLPIFLIIIILAICPVLCPVYSAFSQEDVEGSAYFGQEEFPPEEPEPQDFYNPNDEGPDSLPIESNGEIFDESVSTEPRSVAIEVNGEMAEEIEETDNNLISLDLKGINIEEVFRMLSMKIGKTVVAGKGVSGRVNLFLNNVTFEDALEVILITQGLACERNGNIIMVMRAAEYKRRYGKEYDEKREFRSFKLKYTRPASVFSVLTKLKSDVGKIIVDEGSGNVMLIDIPEKLDLMEKVMRDIDRPLKTQTFDLNYAEADVMGEYLANKITDGPGKIFVDKRTNKIIVSDLDEKIKDMERMVESFDEESKQVFIEAMILQITLKEEFQRGINWEKILADATGQFSWLRGLNMAGTFPASPSYTPSPEIDRSNMTMSIGTLEAQDYTIALKFLETFGDTKVLSRPKISVLNNKEASILVGAREAYVTQSLSQGESTTVTSESVEFIDVGVKLNVIPTIHNDGFVTLQIAPEVSAVRETLSTALGSNIPIVETSEVSTTIRIKSGATVLIGGLMKEEQRDDVSGLPILNKIPIIRTFFGSRAKLKKKTEMVIFLRPHIITGDNDAIVGENNFNDLTPPAIWYDAMKLDFIKSELDKVGSDDFEGRSEENNLQSFLQTTTPDDMFIQKKLKGIKNY